ncbi:MAG: hypothetical protein JWR51_1201 [Devosia sp.]|uniref:hypothetical protein n=1 Tax=Devosia sp. TaxID=1871048 RepID=UPI00261202C1|nr:hypothetical protein [Devosia sp.]MDB5528098.1 hypothetical protein [Devosia sp.]
MTSEHHAILADGLLKLFPPIVQSAFLDRPEFLESHGLQVLARVEFGEGMPSFERRELFSAIREVYKSDRQIIVNDISGDNYEVQLSADKQRLLLISSESGEVGIPSFWFLNGNDVDRLDRFDLAIDEYALQGAEAVRWRERVEIGIADDDVEGLLAFFRQAPESVWEAIKSDIAAGRGTTSNLVPQSITYFEQLIGNYRGTSTLKEYIDRVLPPHLDAILARGGEFALSRTLVLCAHSSISEAIGPKLSLDLVVRHFAELARSGDRLSQLGAIEVGIRLLATEPGLELPLLQMAQLIVEDDPADASGRLSLISALTIFVDGELSRLGIFENEAPFLRRLAAFSHAAAVERQLIAAGVDMADFSRWATAARGQRYFLQTLTDLRLEPRWLPDFISPEQLKAEFVSRLAGAADRHRTSIPSGKLNDFLFSTDVGRLRAAMAFPYSYLPGPLEGGLDSPAPLPDEISEQLSQLAHAEEINEGSLAAFVNTVLIFQITKHQTKLVTEALRRVKYEVVQMDNDAKTFNLLSGLAVAAAVARDTELAGELRILARTLRRRAGAHIDTDSSLRIALIASASEVDLGRWSEMVGQWLTELGYEETNSELAEAMHAHIDELCKISPVLWRTCARAQAAFEAKIALLP